MDSNLGLIAIAAAISIFGSVASSIGEAMIACKTIEGMYRNPEMSDKLRSNMIMAMALDETCAIYALLVSILIIFVLGSK